MYKKYIYMFTFVCFFIWLVGQLFWFGFFLLDLYVLTEWQSPQHATHLGVSTELRSPSRMFATNSQSELGHGQFMLAVVITISEGPCVSRYVSVWHSWVGEIRLVTSDLVFTTNGTSMQELRYGEEDASASWKVQAFWKNPALKEGFFS